jgi:hypothetical protein
VTPESQILLGSIVGGSGAMLSYWAGWRARGSQRPPRGSYGNCVPLPSAPPYRRDLDPDCQPTFAELLMPPTRDLDPDWRRSFNHENINRPTGEPPLNLRRRGDGYSSGPTTPKPDIIPKPQS